jgi:hypothetical protein
MKKTVPGILLLAVAAFAGWTWWKRRQTTSPGEVAIAPNGDTSLLPNLSQVGSNVYQDVTGDLVEKLIAGYERVTGGCWRFTGACWGSPRHCEYENSITRLPVLYPVGTFPTPLCGGAGAAGNSRPEPISLKGRRPLRK